jgi:hypothetical protein
MELEFQLAGLTDKKVPACLALVSFGRNERAESDRDQPIIPGYHRPGLDGGEAAIEKPIGRGELKDAVDSRLAEMLDITLALNPAGSDRISARSPGGAAQPS